MAKHLRWGIMGTGNIAGQFAQGISDALPLCRGELAAVSSRRQATADAFADRFAIANRHAGYEAMLHDDTVDAVYISLPNTLHYAWTLKALEAGKHVLCEKPIAVSAAQGQEMFDLAQRKGLVLVEAFMYRSHPLTAAVLEKLCSGAIGRLKLIRTSFCFSTRKVQGNIRFSADLAGGSLMDVGCYCTSFARLCAGGTGGTGGEPTRVQCTAQLHESGVDESAAGCLHFEGGLIAQFVCSLTAQTDNSAHLCGTEGFLTVPIPWKPPVRQARYLLRTLPAPRQDGSARRSPGEHAFSVDADRPLYCLEADDFAATVLDAAPPAVSRGDSLGNLRVLEQLRQQAGLAY